MKPTTKILKGIFRLMAMSQAPALPTLPSIAGQAKRFRLMGHAQGFVRLMALLTMGALSSASFALSLGGPLVQGQSCPSPLGIAALPPQLYPGAPYLPWDLYPPPGRATICTGAASGKACSGHYVYVPGTPAGGAPTMRAPLFVFFPGTGGEPDKYEHLLKMAAYAGYRTVGLAYDSDGKVEDSCANALTCGSNCQGLVRDEIITGQDTTVKEDVLLGDAILPRLYDLLTKLYDDDLVNGVNDYGWDAYYVPATDPATITLDNFVWSKIIVSGHSQGGGHAEKISVDRQVHGIVVFEGGRDTCEKIEIVRDPPRVIRKTVAAEWASKVPAGGASAGTSSLRVELYGSHTLLGSRDVASTGIPQHGRITRCAVHCNTARESVAYDAKPMGWLQRPRGARHR